MSYWDDKMKELEEEKKKKKKTVTPDSDYWGKKMDELKNGSPDNYQDIAPVKETEEKKWYEGWFNKGAFDDGYQFGDVLKTAYSSIADVRENLATGILGMGEKVVDAGAYLVGGAADLFGADEFADKTKEFIAKDLYDERKVASVLPAGAIDRILVGGDYNEYSVFDEKTDSVAQSGGQLLATAGLQLVGVPWFVTTGVTSFGSETENAFNQGAEYGEAGGSAIISAGAEILTEKLSGGIKFGGKTLGDKYLQPLINKISNKVVRTGMNLGLDAVGEGTEEIFSQVFSNLGSALYREEDLSEILASEEAFDEYLESFIGGMALGGGMGSVNAASSIKSGRDYKTGLTSNEQKVVDKEVADRISEAESDGKKLTDKEKAKIEEDVLSDLKKGYISTDKIESILGGETYKSYQDTIDSEEAAIEELKTLYSGAELDNAINDILSNSKRTEIKNKLSQEVADLTAKGKDSYLSESYNEAGRRTQRFEADFTKYDTKAQETIKKAAESGVLNNTRRTHEFVDMIAKISADKGVLFDFTNNEKLKQSGFAIGGKTINGYYADGGVTVNIDSQKSLNSIVGHEITHVLEGTEFYDALQETIFAYAKTKGVYEDMLKKTRDIYKDIDGYKGVDGFKAIKREVVSDLVGDYLFTDPDFINHLSGNRNVFQKVYDEIKYLCKIATAGSKEARELAKVQRAFEKAYRADSKAEGETKYSVSDKNIKDVSTGYGYGETYFTMSYTQDGKTVAKLDYGVYEDAPNVKMIEVDPEYRRKGIATKLLKELQKKYPDTEIDFGMSTPDGTKLLDSITYNVTDEAIAADQQKLKDLQTELNELQGKLDILYDTENLTEAQEAELEKLGDRWEEVYHDIYDLENSLRGKKATKTFVKYSISDSDGNALTNEQQKYFKDSKVRDENGNLKVMYHGTPNGNFTVFKDGTYFTDNKEYADRYQNPSASSIRTGKTASNPKTFEVYLDIKKPFDINDEEARDIYINDYIKGGNAMGINPYLPDSEYDKITTIDWTEGEDLRDFLIDNEYDYDGLILDEGADGGYGEDVKYRGKSYVVFSPEQIKNIDNKKPTSNKDIRYSLSDSDGKKLTKEQREYFKDSKMRDENGALKVMYHGSQDAGFHVFDGRFSDDDMSFFFVDRNDVAASYSGTTETYEAKTIKTIDDFNKFVESIDVEGYEVIEKDGKYTLLYDGDKVATKDTMQEIYDEFCWYEGVGNGDANYKVYLNLKNPLEVDGKGRPWNKIDAEFSPEVYRKYSSLTAEEKAALVDLAEWEDFRIFNSEIQEATEGALASAYKKMGEDCNIYDLFSVAADNFSKESMRENSRKYLKTRDFAQKAKDGGYDGVIFKNIHDNGGYSNGDEGASTVAIAFNSNQIKSVANQKPTENSDIRYSISEYTEDEKKAHNDVVLKHFGKTYKWAETGYLLLDGSKLDLSGKHDGAPGGYRTVDHRDITEALGDDYGGGDYSGSLVQFMSEGNIRIIPEINGINLSVKPTVAQERSLSDYISRFRGEMVLDIDDLNGNTVVSVEYPRGTYYTKVLNDIREWFDNGKRPEVSGFSRFYSLTKNGNAKSRGRYNVYGKDVRLEQDIAPIAEKKTVPQTDNKVTYDLSPEPMPVGANEAEIARLEARAEELERTMLERDQAGGVTPEEANALYSEYMQTLDKIDNLKAQAAEAETQNTERLETLNEAPPETEAPYYGEDEEAAPNDPFESRDYKAVGNQKQKAYMYENPEVKPFFQAEAEIMLGELQRTTKGERWYAEINGEGRYYGTKRHTSDDIAYLRDNGRNGYGSGYTYAEIEAGLKAIIEDNGKENNACSKRIEFLLNDRLLKGYRDMEGMDVPADDNYIRLIREKEISEYSNEARQKYFEATDDIAPVKETEETMIEKPVADGEQMKLFNDPETKKTVEKKPFREQKKAPETSDEEKIAKVWVGEPEVPKKKKRTLMNLATDYVDKGAPVEKLAMKTKNRELQSKYNFMHYSENRAQHYIKNNLKPLLDKIEKTGKTEEFFTYVYHLHNVDRMSLDTAENKAKREELRGKYFDGMSDKAIEQTAKQWITNKTPKYEVKRIKAAREYVDANKTKNKPVFGDSMTAELSRRKANRYEYENPEFIELGKEIVEYNKALRQLMVDNNLISQETADLWEKEYPHYVPIRRLDHEGAAVNVPLDSRKTSVNAPIKRATGGNSDIGDLGDTMAMRTEQIFKAIARNNFGLELMHTLDSVVDKNDVGMEEVMENLDKHEELLKKGENGNAPTFTVFENGKRVEFEITEDLYNSMKPTSPELSRTYLSSKAVEAFKKVTTQYSMKFMFSNPIKDVQDIILNSQHPLKTYANLPKAFYQLATKGKYYREYMENGGEQNTYFDSEKKTFKEESLAKKIALGFPRGINMANDFIERMPRLAEYMASRKKGASIETAMLDAARVTTNFNAGGDMTKFAGRNFVPFLNPSVQGAAQQVRNVREAAADGLSGVLKLTAKYAVAGIPVLILNSLFWDDDEEYEELSDYVKENYYIVAKFDDGKFVRIPKGRTVAVIQSAVEQIANLFSGEETDFASTGKLAMSNLAPNNPLESNILSTINQIKTNRTWYGEELVPQRLQDMPAAEQYDESIDLVSRWLAEKLSAVGWEVSPYHINYLIDQYTGGIGDMLLPPLTPETTGGEDSVMDYAVAPWKDLFTTDSVMKNQNVSDFYETVDELKKNANSMYATDEDILKSKYMNAINSELGELYKKKREIQSDTSISESTKYDMVRIVQYQIDELAKQSLNTYGNVSIDDGYATVGNLRFRMNADGVWEKISDKQSAKQDEVTESLGISADEYWSNKEEYDFAYNYPERYAVAKAVGGYESYKTYSSALWDIKADKDANGKTITGSRKEKVIKYINNLNADYYEKIILYKSEYTADDTYNYEIIEYLNSREDISYKEMKLILEELGFTVDSNGNITWD